ncbi:MAG TPA: DMT family transporter [Burkholderiaceae bacterium]|nr:DMT family transporter [Burkholderiaceae bacterium]
MDASAATTMVLLCAIWALGQIAIKVGNGGISPLWQTALRSVGAGLLVAGWMTWRGRPLVPPRAMAGWGVAIGAAFALEFVCLFIGLSLTTAARGSVLLYTAPFFVALGGHRLLDDRLTPTRVAGLVLAFAGVAVALGDRAAGAAAQGDALGDVLCLAGGFMWAATTLIIKATPLREEPPERTLLVQLVVSAPLLALAAVLAGERGIAPDASPLAWAALGYQVLVVASFSYLGWFIMVQRHSPAKVSAYTFLTPLFGVAFAAVLLREPLTPLLAVAAALIAVGIWLVNRR